MVAERGLRAQPGRRFLVIGDVVADSERNLVLREGEIIKLEPKVMALLLYLAANHGRVVGRGELIAGVWGGLHVVDEAIQRAVSILRAALGDDARHPRLIETVPTRGYRLLVGPRPLEKPMAPTAGSFAKSRFIGLLLAALLAGLVVGAAFVRMSDQPVNEAIAPPAPAPSRDAGARKAQPAPRAP